LYYLADSGNNPAGGLRGDLGVSAKGASNAHGGSRCHLGECVERAKLQNYNRVSEKYITKEKWWLPLRTLPSSAPSEQVERKTG